MYAKEEKKTGVLLRSSWKDMSCVLWVRRGEAGEKGRKGGRKKGGKGTYLPRPRGSVNQVILGGRKKRINVLVRHGFR